MTSTSSLDPNQKIFINKACREILFNDLFNSKDDAAWVKFLWSADNLERYCLGKTGLPDYAYSHIRALLKKEYVEWKKLKQ